MPEFYHAPLFFCNFGKMNVTKHRILGIDPGTNYTGYGVLEVDGNHLSAIAIGYIDIHKLTDPYQKLKYIFERILSIVDEYHPEEIALESPFYGNNIQSMLKLGRAQGVAMAAALHRNLKVTEYAPRRIKQSIAGVGSASKEQISDMILKILNIKNPPKKLDATDGMAVALCHYYNISSPIANALGESRIKGLGGDKKAKRKGSSSWEKFLKENPDREIK